MKLADFYPAIAPLLEGREALEQAAPRLYGPGWAGSRDARRLGIYARFCRLHRHDTLADVYPHGHKVVLRHGGEARWDALVAAYFTAHPMTDFELYANAAHLPAFLPEYVAGAGLPAWLAGLADFEWWEWQTAIAPDPQEAVAPGRLRIAPSVELRSYDHDYVTWLDEVGGPVEGEPAGGGALVLFWRDRDLDPRRELATPEELAVLRVVHEGHAGKDDEGLLDKLSETVADLREAGILLT